jgi:hypothetical protein
MRGHRGVRFASHEHRRRFRGFGGYDNYYDPCLNWQYSELGTTCGYPFDY